MKWRRPIVPDWKISRSDAYIASIVLLGSSLIVRSIYLWTSDNPWLYLGFAAATLLTSVMKVSLPGIKGTISVAYVFVLLSITRFSMSETIVLAVAACLTQCLWRPKKRVAIVETSFSVASVAGVVYRPYARGCHDGNEDISTHASATTGILVRVEFTTNDAF